MLHERTAEENVVRSVEVPLAKTVDVSEGGEGVRAHHR